MNDNSFRRLRGRRGPNYNNSSVNYMNGSFVVQFFDEDFPEEFTINDANPDVYNNEIRSTSPLAKAVMNNEVGTSLYIDSYVYDQNTTTVGITIFKKNLKYLNYNPALDDKAEFNYYYVKSYLDYVKPRLSEEITKSKNKDKSKTYIDFKFVSKSVLNRRLEELANLLKSKLYSCAKHLSNNHKEACELKIRKLLDLKNKNFYKEDLDFIEKDIFKYVKYDITYFSIFDNFANSIIDFIVDLDMKIDEKELKHIKKYTKQLLSLNTIDEGEEILKELSKVLSKNGLDILNCLRINYRDDDMFEFDEYQFGTEKEYEVIYSHYKNKVDKYIKKGGYLSKTHKKIIMNELSKTNFDKYNNSVEFENHLSELFDSEFIIYCCYDKAAYGLKNLLSDEEYSFDYSKENIYKQIDTIIQNTNIEGIYQEFNTLLKMLDNIPNISINYYDSILTYNFSSFDYFLIWMYLQKLLNNHKSIIRYIKENMKKTNNRKNSIVNKSNEKNMSNLISSLSQHTKNSENNDDKVHYSSVDLRNNLRKTNNYSRRKSEKNNIDQNITNNKDSIMIITAVFLIVLLIIAIVYVGPFIFLLMTIPIIGFITSILIIPSYGVWPFIIRSIIVIISFLSKNNK